MSIVSMVSNGDAGLPSAKYGVNWLGQWRTAEFVGLSKPILLVSVDCEETWRTGSCDYASVDVTCIAKLPNIQRLFDEYGVLPHYLVDYPVAANPACSTLLSSIWSSGRCVVGAHLHPWVNPPFEEIRCNLNSYAANLSAVEQERKLRTLRDEIEGGIGVRPCLYKAGRYGLGGTTLPVLSTLGFNADMSITPARDWRDYGGPDYRGFPLEPHWLGQSGVLAVPLTGAFVGPLASRYRLHDWLKTYLGGLHLCGVLDRLGLLRQISLSPENQSFARMRALTELLLSAGTRIFTLSFHSPSLLPGDGPYVSSDHELAAFLERLRRYFEYFFREVRGMSMDAQSLRALAICPP